MAEPYCDPEIDGMQLVPPAAAAVEAAAVIRARGAYDIEKLYGISRELIELIQFRDEETLEGSPERAAADGAIAEYVGREVSKVDGLRAYVRHCDAMATSAAAEVAVQQSRAASWQARKETLKSMILSIMVAQERKRFDGSTGYFIVKGNGGLKPLDIRDETLVPGQYCDAVVTMPLLEWLAIAPRHLVGKEQRVVKNSLVRAALEQRCPACNGDAGAITCSECGDEGTLRVPGARLEARGVHLEVK